MEEAIRKERKKEPWGLYLSLKKGEQISLSDFILKVQNIALKNLQQAALISVLYLTGARKGEILKPFAHRKITHKKKSGESVEYNYDRSEETGLKIRDIFLDPSDSEFKEGMTQWMVIKTPVEKRKEKRAFFRYSEIRIDELDSYYPLLIIFNKYLEQNFDFQKDKDKEVFTIKISKINFIFRKYGLTPHFLRHLRASHLMRYHRFSPADLMQFFAWKSPNQPLEYARSDRRTIRERLKGDLL